MNEQPKDLAASLAEAGHQDIAEQLRRKQLAGELRKGGRDDLADALESGAEQKPPVPVDAQRQADDEFLAEIKAKAASGWTSVPGLLDR